jgi:hypothetical protein
MNQAKIKLSEEEMQLVQNPGIILTKNAVIQKVISLFGQISEEMKEVLGRYSFPEPVMKTSPKISKGENYLGLPYVMLDYPRYFTQTHIFALRSFFWWGNYFSLTLHLTGDYKDLYAPLIRKHLSFLAHNQFSICTSEDPWRHELAEDNYMPLSRITENEACAIIDHHPFLKLTVHTGFEKWAKVDRIVIKQFQDILSMISEP